LHSSDTGGKRDYNGRAYRLFIDFKKAYDSVRREVLHNNLIEFGVHMKVVRLIKMCLSKTFSEVSICKYLSDNFLRPLGKFRKTKWD
jgi:sorting nexin-29